MNPGCVKGIRPLMPSLTTSRPAIRSAKYVYHKDPDQTCTPAFSPFQPTLALVGRLTPNAASNAHGSSHIGCLKLCWLVQQAGSHLSPFAIIDSPGVCLEARPVPSRRRSSQRLQIALERPPQECPPASTLPWLARTLDLGKAQS